MSWPRLKSFNKRGRPGRNCGWDSWDMGDLLVSGPLIYHGDTEAQSRRADSSPRSSQRTQRRTNEGKRIWECGFEQEGTEGNEPRGHGGHGAGDGILNEITKGTEGAEDFNTTARRARREAFFDLGMQRRVGELQISDCKMQIVD